MTAEEKQLLALEMLALRKILGIDIVVEMRHENTRAALNLTIKQHHSA